MRRSAIALRAACLAPSLTRGLFWLSLKGYLPSRLYRHWLAETIRTRVPSTRPRWVGTVTRLATGLPIEVDVRDQIGCHIRDHGYWEPETAVFLLSVLRSGMTFIDVGANVGQYTPLASRAVGAGGRVIAFEPHPVVHRVLCRNIRRARCRNVVAEKMALGRTASLEPLYPGIPETLGGTSLRPWANTDRARPVTIPVTSLDLYASRHGITVDVMKVDVEGAELLVLEGGAASLARSPRATLIIEFFEERARLFGHSVFDIAQYLHTRGFTLHTLTSSGLRAYEASDGLQRCVNVIATRTPESLVGRHPAPAVATKH